MFLSNQMKNLKNKIGVSVIISAHSAASYIEECVTSIAAQTYFKDFKDYEILVGVDGCLSTLNEMIRLKETIKNLKVLWFPVNSGPYLVFNTLVSVCNFEAVSVFGADDIMDKTFVEHNISLLKNKSCVFARGANFNHPNKEEITREYNPDGVITFNRLDFLSVNGFEKWRCGADSDLKVRFKIAGLDLINSKSTTFLRRVHENSLTSSRSKYGFGGEYRKKIQAIVRSRTNAKIKNYSVLSHYQII